MSEIQDYNRAASARDFWYKLTSAVTALALGYGLLTPDKAQLWGALLVILLPNLASTILAMRNVHKAPPTVPAPEPVAVPTVDEVASAVVSRLRSGENALLSRDDLGTVPSLDDIVAGVVSSIAEMPAPAPAPVPRSDHGVEVQGVTSDAPVAS